MSCKEMDSAAQVAEAGDRRVSHFREILFWPLRLNVSGSGDSSNTFNEAVTLLRESGAPWFPVDSYFRGEYEHDERLRESRYAEFVYFHPFVQNFLYGNTAHGAPSPSMRIFERTDIAVVNFVRNGAKEDANPLKLGVERLHLYLFDLSIAILVLEVSTDNIALELAESVLDELRRAYPPYWKNGLAGNCPTKVEFLGKGGATIAVSDYSDRDNHLRQVEESVRKNEHEPPVAAHWRKLLEPFAASGNVVGHRRIIYSQCEDERIPLMALLSFRDPSTELTRGDMVRLALADEQGSSRTYPYAQSFLSDFEELYCYDRYWGQCGDQDWMKTRYMCCGYAFVAIGQQRSPDFFMNKHSGALAHFRQHYFQMGLIAHFQKAALLSFSARMSETATLLCLENRGDPKLRTLFQGIYEDFLRFTQRFWFDEISNQVQGRELFDLWTQHLETRKLFDDVRQWLRDTQEYLDLVAQAQQAKTTTHLTTIATIGLPVAIGTSFLGMNGINAFVPSGKDLGMDSPVVWGSLTLLLFVTVLMTWLFIWKPNQASKSLGKRNRENTP